MLKLSEPSVTLWEQDKESRRQFRRWSVDISALIDFEGTTHYGVIVDVSPRGARIVLVEDLPIPLGSTIEIDMGAYAPITAKVLYASRGIVRVVFLHGKGDEEAIALWLKSLNPHRRQKRHACDIPTSLRFLERDCSCTVINLSRNGAAVKMSDHSSLAIGSELILELPDHDPVLASVRHFYDDALGLVLIDGYLGDLLPTEFNSEA